MDIGDRIPGLEHSRTTPRYAMWHANELELRSFLLTTSTGMKAWFKSEEEAAEEEARRAFDPQASYGDEAYSLFMDRVAIFWEHYWYQLAAGVIKDGFTLYEIFLEESAHDLLRAHGSGLRYLSTEKTWLLNECHDFYDRYLGGFQIKRLEIENIQWIRHKLSHLRDSLRTVGGKAEFEERIEALGISGAPSQVEDGLGIPHYDYGRDLAFAKSLTLSPLEAWWILDKLRAHVEELTVILHRIQYGRRTTQALYDLSKGKPVKERDWKLLIAPE
ncbi:hypothetical protein [Paenarthrobacter nicotinovorans]|uniref:hypothetical protein n=1 Tax=Paenarthrobacter nicotinovorans TaxID=29320 RepID=UPI001662ED9D|nr:hypothetical protein [Paenarthrobacter nicotinovorans]MBP2392779.1 hypothetical protein [Paenarthrobacter nicotinovorans]UKF00918.1 hypothetical protein LU808_09020 [Paenarthrobacter nicotinovorans]UKF05701.1 hypothetical protein JMY29_09055 [Paenarthrobacter nicotinovorans]